jgi:hypothetical protein
MGALVKGATVDDDGFICVVNSETYSGFVRKDWELEEVLAKFVEQMDAHTLFVAFTGPDDLANEPLAVVDAPSGRPAAREASALVEATGHGLWLVDYSALTMVAQYADEELVDRAWHKQLALPPGLYRVTLRHLSDKRRPPFELVVAAAPGATLPPHDGVRWFDDLDD